MADPIVSPMRMDGRRRVIVTRTALSASLVVIGLAGNFASAQNPAVGQLPPPGDLYGYSPLVRTIDPFPTRTSGYAPSIFLPGIGGKRIYPPLATYPHQPVVVVERSPLVEPAVPAPMVVGPVEWPLPARGWHRFRR
jgi:hypothetical protein